MELLERRAPRSLGEITMAKGGVPYDIELLLKKYPEAPEEKEFRSWFKLNRQIFQEQAWAPDEIAYLAVNTNGFDPHIVFSVLSLWNDVITGTCFENRADLKEFNWAYACSEFLDLKAKLEYIKELDMTDQWKSLVSHQVVGDD